MARPDKIPIFTELVGKIIGFEEMDLVWPNMVLLLVQNSETGVNISKITKNHIFYIFERFCQQVLHKSTYS